MTLATAQRLGSSWSTRLAFLGVVVLGGVNAVAVRIENRELAPLWGAALRFGTAAVVLVTVVTLTRIPWPRGRALTGSILYGAVGFAGAFGFIHWALVRVPPASAQTVLALVPLLTFLFAVGQGFERFRTSGLVGGLVAAAGVAAIFEDPSGASTPIPSLVAICAGAACMAESNIIAKRFPSCHPVAKLAVAMTVGAVILLAVSMLMGEPHAVPIDAATWGALAYVSLAGSVGVFLLFVHVVQQWTASTASYVMLLMPLVTVVVASVVSSTAVTPGFLAGGALVAAGVYIGALRSRRAPATSTPPLTPLRSEAQPGCA
jgi:drug/metabolite transporter (DMT)-like permease